MAFPFGIQHLEELGIHQALQFHLDMFEVVETQY